MVMLMLLWSFEEVAAQLGGISIRTVRRLVELGELPVCRVGRLVRIPSDAVRTYVSRMTEEAHNRPRTESVTWKGNKSCHTDARTRRTGGSNTPMQAEKQLTDLLGQLTLNKRKPSKQNGDSKPINSGSGVFSLNTPLTK
jgi:excisionase family DNA binding protein